eukprot:TRINITY_DN66371_c4_g1_i1.p1 TRINITY_DN66371_c4_g1~~TRINITY_DN66371_c4_g1_i1.p1  ORF type:complete len:597 (-),score=256.38 TRINITY_DN66371_c4_g1_i1:8-1798(-)
MTSTLTSSIKDALLEEVRLTGRKRRKDALFSTGGDDDASYATEAYGAAVVKNDEDEDDDGKFFVRDVLGGLVQSEAFSDVVFTFAGEASDGDGGGDDDGDDDEQKKDDNDDNNHTNKQRQKLHAHRMVLAARSPVFEAMLYPLLPSQEAPAKMTVRLGADVERRHFVTLLQLIYSDRATLNPSNVVGVMKLAKKYQVEVARIACAKYASEGMKASNACSLLEHGGELVQRNECVNFIVANFVAVSKTEDFGELSKQSLLEVLAREDLAVHQETEVFRAVLAWANHQTRLEWSRQHPDDVIDEKGERFLELRREVLHDVLELVRFPLMTMAQLSTVVAVEYVLPSEVLVQLYTYVSIDNEQVPKEAFPLIAGMKFDRRTGIPPKNAGLRGSNKGGPMVLGRLVPGWTFATRMSLLHPRSAAKYVQSTQIHVRDQLRGFAVFCLDHVMHQGVWEWHFVASSVARAGSFSLVVGLTVPQCPGQAIATAIDTKYGKGGYSDTLWAVDCQNMMQILPASALNTYTPLHQNVRNTIRQGDVFAVTFDSNRALMTVRCITGGTVAREKQVRGPYFGQGLRPFVAIHGVGGVRLEGRTAPPPKN